MNYPAHMCIMINMASQSSYKRIPISPLTWEHLSMLKKPGETFDHLISDLIEERQKQEIIRHVMHVSEKGDFISLDDARIAWDVDEGWGWACRLWFCQGTPCKKQAHYLAHLHKLEEPVDALWIERLGNNVYRMHVGRTYTIFFCIIMDRNFVQVTDILPIELAHKRYWQFKWKEYSLIVPLTRQENLRCLYLLLQPV